MNIYESKKRLVKRMYLVTFGILVLCFFTVPRSCIGEEGSKPISPNSNQNSVKEVNYSSSMDTLWPDNFIICDSEECRNRSLIRKKHEVGEIEKSPTRNMNIKNNTDINDNNKPPKVCICCSVKENTFMIYNQTELAEVNKLKRGRLFGYHTCKCSNMFIGNLRNPDRNSDVQKAARLAILDGALSAGSNPEPISFVSQEQRLLLMMIFIETFVTD